MSDWIHHDLSKSRRVLRRTVVRRGPSPSNAPRERFDWAEMTGAVPHVSEPTRLRINRIRDETGKLAREVHATIRGTLLAAGNGEPPSVEGLRRIRFNPFRASTFTYDNGEEWKGGESARVIVSGGYAYEIS